MRTRSIQKRHFNDHFLSYKSRITQQTAPQCTPNDMLFACFRACFVAYAVPLCALVLVLSLAGSAAGQNPLEQRTAKGQEGAQPPSSGGSSTGGAYPAQPGPPTVSGTVVKGEVPFVDVTAKSGLGAWQHVSGDTPRRFILDAIGSGVALLDYDNDGWLDI